VAPSVNSTQVRPGVSRIGWPSAPVSVIGSSWDGRFHVPVTAVPPAPRTVTLPVPSVFAVGVLEPPRYWISMITTFVAFACPVPSVWSRLLYCHRSH
jgi:hypothetical protein